MPCGPKNCCAPIVIKTKSPCPPPQCVQVQVPSQTVTCEVPPPPRAKKTTCCNIPVVICDEQERCPPKRNSGSNGGGCCPSPCCPPPPCCIPGCSPCCRPSCCMPPINFNSSNMMRNNDNNGGCGKKVRREKRWPMCNFMKPCLDTRIYRDGEAMVISYAGHIPGEQFIHGRNLPTTTTFAKRRLCQYTPYEFIDPDGCCTFP